MTRLSVNINKIATLRNARGGNNPDIIRVALDCERFGAQGITVHPRPDERHIRRQDVIDLAAAVKTEFNIEGYPDERYLEMVGHVRPAQATLVPDPPGVITSDAGWDTRKNSDFLREVTAVIKSWGVRVSVFTADDPEAVRGAADAGVDRVELYTGPYAHQYLTDRDKAIASYILAAQTAADLGLGVNAGHDLDLINLAWLHRRLPKLDEVSIGHALVCDALYLGLENTIQLYLRQLRD